MQVSCSAFPSKGKELEELVMIWCNYIILESKKKEIRKRKKLLQTTRTGNMQRQMPTIRLSTRTLSRDMLLSRLVRCLLHVENALWSTTSSATQVSGTARMLPKKLRQGGRLSSRISPLPCQRPIAFQILHGNIGKYLSSPILYHCANLSVTLFHSPDLQLPLSVLLINYYPLVLENFLKIVFFFMKSIKENCRINFKLLITFIVKDKDCIFTFFKKINV